MLLTTDISPDVREHKYLQFNVMPKVNISYGFWLPIPAYIVNNTYYLFNNSRKKLLKLRKVLNLRYIKNIQ